VAEKSIPVNYAQIIYSPVRKSLAPMKVIPINVVNDKSDEEGARCISGKAKRILAQQGDGSPQVFSCLKTCLNGRG
jgi:hypothetical protein